MIGDIIQEIKQAEAQAGAILAQADETCARIQAEARAEAEALKMGKIQEAKQKAAEAMWAVEEDGEWKMKFAMEEMDKDLAFLKKEADQKSEEATEAVIRMMLS